VTTFSSRIWAAAAVFGLILATPATAQDGAGQQPSAASDAQSSLTEGYVLGPGDIVEVAVLGRDDYRARVQVQVDGTIQLPLINDITAANRTVLQLRREIQSGLISGGYFTSPAISVSVVSYASRYVTVLGEVATPGLVPIDRSYRVSEILARVGGHRPTAADVLTLSRADGNNVELDIAQIATGSGDADPVVNPGDRIFIAPAAQFFIYGQVNAPGSYRVDRKMSIRMALARGGGLTTQGSEGRVKVIRDGVELKSFDPNGLVLPGDTIVVGERFF